MSYTPNRLGTAPIGSVIASMSVDYQMMENYQLESSFLEGSEIAVMPSRDGSGEVLTISGQGTSLILLRESAESDTGWTSEALPELSESTSSGDVITAIAACAGPDGRRIIVAGYANSLYATTEMEPNEYVWYPWSLIYTAPHPAMRVVLGTSGSVVTLGVVVRNAIFGTQPRGQISCGPLQANAGVLTWQPSSNSSVSTDSVVLQFSANVGNGEGGIVSCMTPTLVSFAVNTFVTANGTVSPIWSTSGGKYQAGDQIGFYRPSPVPDPNVFVLCDYALNPTDAPASIACVASIDIDPMYAPGNSPLIAKVATIEKLWDDEKTGTTLSGSVYQPVAPPGGLYSAVGWLAVKGTNNGKNTISVPQSTLTWQGISCNIGCIRNDALQWSDAVQTKWTVGQSPVWTTEGQPGRHFLALYPLLDALGNPTGVTWPQTSSTTLPNHIDYPGVLYKAPSWVIGQSASGVPVLDSLPPVGRTQAFSNFCSVDLPGAVGASWMCFGVEQGSQELFFLGVGAQLWTMPASGSWFQPASGQNGSTLTAVFSGDVCHLFGINLEGDLVHLFCDFSAASPTWTSPAVIAEGVCAVEANAIGDSVEVFALASSSNSSILHLTLDEGGWTQTAIEVGGPGTGSTLDLTPITSYTATANFYDASGAPTPFSNIAITTSANCLAIVNGVTMRLIAHATPTIVPTTCAAQVTVVIPTQDIAAPTLTFAPASDPSLTLSVTPNSEVAAQLAECTPELLLLAEDANGMQLFQGSYAAPQVAAFSAMISQIGRLALQNIYPSVPPLVRHDFGKNVIAPTPEVAACSITFGENEEIHFSHEIPTKAFDEKYISETPELFSLGSAFYGALADVLKWIKDTANSLYQIVIQSTSSGLQVTIKFYANKLKWIVQTLINPENAVNELLALIEPLFNKVGAEAERVVQWLSKLFNWNHIELMMGVTSNAIITTLDFVTEAIATLETKIDAGLQGIASNLINQLDNLPSSINPDATLGSVNSKLGSSGSLSLVQSQLAFTQAIHHGSSMEATTQTFPLDFATLGASIQATLGTLPSDLQPLFQSISTPEQLLQQTLVSVKKIIEAIMAGVVDVAYVVINAVLEKLQELVESVKDALNSPMHIPWISQLLQAKFNISLTPLYLVSLLNAIPACVLGAAITGSALFPDAASAAAFNAKFNSKTLADIVSEGPDSESLRDMDTSGVTTALGVFTLAPSMMAVPLNTSIDAMAFPGLEGFKNLRFSLSILSLTPILVGPVVDAINIYNRAGMKSIVSIDDCVRCIMFASARCSINTMLGIVNTTLTLTPYIQSIARLVKGDIGVGLGIGSAVISSGIAISDEFSAGLAYESVEDAGQTSCWVEGCINTAGILQGTVRGGLLTPFIEISDGTSVAAVVAMDGMLTSGFLAARIASLAYNTANASEIDDSAVATLFSSPH